MCEKLSITVEIAMRQALDDYYNDIFELDYVPEKVSEILEKKLNKDGQKIYTRPFWIEDNDADLDSALEETIKFCTEHKVKDYAVGLDDSEGLVFVAYLVEENNNA